MERSNKIVKISIVVCLLFYDMALMVSADKESTPHTCSIEMSLSNDQQIVTWDPMNPVSSQYANIIQAKPICLDEFKLPINRKCEKSQWSPLDAPSCDGAQKAFDQNSVLCPPNYSRLQLPSSRKTICVLVTDPQPWRNVCLADGAFTTFYELPKDEKKLVLTFLQTREVDQLWMPAKRWTKFGSVLWTLGGDLNGETVEFDGLDISVNDGSNIVGHSCFSALVESKLKTGHIGSCAVELPILCIYREHAEKMVQLACPTNFYTTPFRGRQQHCYSGHHISSGSTSKPKTDSTPPETNDERRKNDEGFDLDGENWIPFECHGGDLMTVNSSTKVTMFRQLAEQIGFSRKDNCLFAVTDRNVYVRDRSHWVNVAKSVPYVNWNYPIRNGIYLTTDRNGKWNWIDESFNCVLCEQTIDVQSPVLVLNFDEAKGRLYLIVYGEEFLWRRSHKEAGVKCFTNADYDLVKTVKVQDKKWSGILNADESFPLGPNEQPRTISKTIYELKLYGDGPGYYWCSGHAIPDFRSIKAPEIVAYRHLKGDVFAALINTACDKCEKLFLKKHIRQLARELSDYLRDLYRNVKHDFAYKINIENVRVMQIDEIQSKRYAKILYHISVSTSYDFDAAENSLKIPANQFRIYKIKEILEQVLTTAKSSKFTYLSLNSTEFCLPDSLEAADNQLSWNSASIGETMAPRELCLLNNGLPVRRQCVGDFLYGGIWHNLTRQQCHSNISDITRQLHQLDRTLSQSNEAHDVIHSLEQLFQNSNREKFVPADLFYLGRLMHTIFELSSSSANKSTSSPLPSTASPLLNKTNTDSILSIYNNLMFLNENTTRISAALNSTNILLDAFDNIINDIPMDIAVQRHNLIVNVDDGTIAAQTPKLIVYVIDPIVTNVSGIALIKRTGLDAEHGDSGDFTDYKVRLLYANQSSLELLTEPNLEIAAFVPQHLLDRLNETRMVDNGTATDDAVHETNDEPLPMAYPSPDVRIVITVYYNDLLFQEYKNVTHAKSSGKIISVSIPGYGPNLPALMPVYVKSHNYTSERGKMCGYWNFRNGNGWSNDGCEYVGSSESTNTTTSNDPVVLCACSHLTHFSFLVLGTYVHSIRTDDEDVIIEAHHVALDMITLLGCSLSLLGIFGIAVTALVFRSWREKPSSKVLLQLSGAVGLQMVLLCFINTENSAVKLVLEDKWFACMALGASLQYSILVAFSWMLITAYLQFMRYVKVLGQTRASRFFFKSFLIGWMIPLIPVLLVLIFAPHSYVQGIKTTSTGICYPSGWALYFGVILPIGLIILANLIIFLLVIYNILYGPGGKLRSNERDLTLSQLRLSVFLFFLLGLTWIFGFLATTKAGLIFSYFFCLTATIQGFVLFVYFIILDPGTRKLWRNFFANYICCCCYGKTDYYK